MKVPNPWARHYQSVWHERAGDRRLPAWLRVAALAYGSHTANGHAQFKPGQVGLILGRVNEVTGEITPMHKAHLNNAIRTAVEYGWLLDESGTRCLVVPGHAVAGGLGNAYASCPQHLQGKSSGRKNGSTVSREDLHSKSLGLTKAPLTSDNVVQLSESSHKPQAPVEADLPGTNAPAAEGGF